VLRELDDHFQRLNIDYMPIKGAYLICAGLAKQIKSRTMSDIDILVREKDFDAVVSYFRLIPDVIIAEGSWPINKKGWPFEVTFLFLFKGRVVHIDFHKLINLRQRFILSTEELFVRGIKQGHRILPSIEDALIICLCHGFVHSGHVFSDDVFNDIYLLANVSINWEVFWAIAKSTGIVAFIYYILQGMEKRGHIRLISVPKKTMKFFYADLLLLTTGNRVYPGMPLNLRRLFIEFPLCRNPFGLVWNKFMRSRRK
jgi:hypothetical protein